MSFNLPCECVHQPAIGTPAVDQMCMHVQTICWVRCWQQMLSCSRTWASRQQSCISSAARCGTTLTISASTRAFRRSRSSHAAAILTTFLHSYSPTTRDCKLSALTFGLMLAALPQSLSGLCRLRRLKLVAYSSSSLPQSLYELSIPQEVSTLSCLTERHTEDVTIGASLNAFVHLQELTMSWFGQFTAAVPPDTPHCFTSLHTITLDSCQLEGGISSFSYFPSLTSLSVTEFPWCSISG